MLIGLVDGDVLAYRAAAAVQKNFDWDGDRDIVSTADPKDAIKACRNLLTQWEQAAGVDEMRIFQSDRRAPKTSFRYHVHPHYKAQRPSTKPVVLLETEDWLRDKHAAEYYPGLEGDDALGIAATGEFAGRGVIISTDKDMRTIPGRCFIVPHMRPLATAAVETIGPAAAVRNTVYQAIVGDAVDNYKGAPGVGKVKASTMIAEMSPMTALTEAFKAAARRATNNGSWDKWVHRDAYDEARMNWRCARILRVGDYRAGDKLPVRLDNPWGEDEWISPF